MEKLDPQKVDSQKLGCYRQCIQTLLMQHDSKPIQADIETELIFDPVRDRYLLMRAGWKAEPCVSQHFAP